MLKHKHIRETVRTFGLELVDLSPCDGSVFKATVKGGDGSTSIIKINRDDGDKDRLTAQYLRRFANEHGKVTFPGKPALPTVLQTAMAEAAQAAEQAMKTAQERIAANPQPKDTDMPKPALSLAKNPPLDAPASAFKPKSRQRSLTHVQFAKLAALIAATDTMEFKGKLELSTWASAKLEFPISPRSLDDALTMHGKTTQVQAARKAPPAGRVTKSNSAVLARAIAHLYTKLGEELPADLKDIL